jgi:hypothetical protein
MSNKVQIGPLITTVVLGAAWVYLTSKNVTPPQGLNQALIGSIGAVFAAGAIPKKGTSSEK